jgi:hypothetical protein
LLGCLTLLRASLKSNQENDLRHSSRGNWLAIFVIILISALLIGFAASEYAQGLAQHSVYSKEASVIQYGDKGIKSFNYLLGNFSGMTVTENFTSPDGSNSGFVISYVLLGTTVVNHIKAYEVNISGTAMGNGEEDPESLLAWVSTSNGLVIQTYDSNDGYIQGIRAEGENATLSMFTTLPFLSMLNSSTVEPVQGSEHSMTLGQAFTQVTTYDGLASFSSLKDWIVQLGVVSSTGVQLVVYCAYFSPSSGYEFAFRIVSLT